MQIKINQRGREDTVINVVRQILFFNGLIFPYFNQFIQRDQTTKIKLMEINAAERFFTNVSNCIELLQCYYLGLKTVVMLKVAICP